MGLGEDRPGEVQWVIRRQGLPHNCLLPHQAVDPMRAAYLDDLRSKFLVENSVLKMEYADVRVLHLAHKVRLSRGPFLLLASPPA